MPPDLRDPALDAELVLALARRHHPAAGVVTGVDESGGEARTYAIDEDLILKTQRPHRVRPRTSLEKEAFHLRQLEAQLPELRAPRVRGYGREGEVEYLLMTRMPGVALRSTAIEGETRTALLRELGALLRRLHGLPLDPLRASGLFPGDADGGDVRRRVAGELERAVEAVGEHRDVWSLDVGPEDLAARVTEALVALDGPIVALHSNPGPEHIFVDPARATLSGLIDFGDAYLSHPAFDMRRWPTAEERAAVVEGYTGGGAVAVALLGQLRIVAVPGLMLDLALRPGRRDRALAGLRSVLADLSGGGAAGRGE